MTLSNGRLQEHNVQHDVGTEVLINQLRAKAKASGEHEKTGAIRCEPVRTKILRPNDYMSLWKDNEEIAVKKPADDETAIEKRKENATVMTNYYYDLVTDLYEYGWGQSFHFGRMFRGDSFAHNIARHECYLALHSGLKPGMKVLDVGCGVGGPMREIAKFTGASIVGLNNNAYQVQRCGYYGKKYGLEKITSAVKGNFLDMPFEANTFDSAYSVEATCHAPRLQDVYGEIFRVLKPGQLYTAYEWCTTDDYDETNAEHKRIVRAIEEGDSLAHMYRTWECIQALKDVGFEVEAYEDLSVPPKDAPEAQEPWYSTLEGTFSKGTLEGMIINFRMAPTGRWFTDHMLGLLEMIRLAPKGINTAHHVLLKAADNLVLGGKMHLFTPMFFFKARKPLTAAPRPRPANSQFKK
ncbi:Delta(24)-sterol C-methyltransferase [Gonapodya sp. JEL0774]|nr:Delta(24)-sterol C-methyltransferase [Gonapodya sp. JEL0774]